MLGSKLPMSMLGKIWDLADMDKDGSLDRCHIFPTPTYRVSEPSGAGYIWLEPEPLLRPNSGSGSSFNLGLIVYGKLYKLYGRYQCCGSGSVESVSFP